ncbi:MAG: hypothetical protein H6569_01500 [Lewinellaceae bacterium]|nr:hypothetical protein [Lewinellaceae bacterium]
MYRRTRLSRLLMNCTISAKPEKTDQENIKAADAPALIIDQTSSETAISDDMVLSTAETVEQGRFENNFCCWF